MPIIQAEPLRRTTVSLIRALGAPDDVAERVARLLVKADLWGVHSHGVRAIPMLYAGFVKSGAIKPTARPVVAREAVASAAVDGRHAFGQIVATFAMEQAIAKAKKVGVGFVTAFNCNHVGSLGDYPLLAAEAGLIGFMAANSAEAVAPFWGTRPILGTNPLSFAFPTGGRHPIVLDMATSAITWGALAAIHRRGETVAPGLILDADGKPTTDPARYFAEPGGAILPLAGHKGYGLALAVDILAGALSGTGTGGAIGWEPQGVALMALDPGAFGDPARFRAEVDGLVARVKAIPKVAGVAEILMPGEREFRLAAERERSGVPIDDEVWKDLGDLARELGIAL
ncbi:MAG: Ldh family oxidoreductase [Alphaproteobacteria bacterium]